LGLTLGDPRHDEALGHVAVFLINPKAPAVGPGGQGRDLGTGTRMATDNGGNGDPATGNRGGIRITFTTA
jgi:hypothetical protein